MKTKTAAAILVLCFGFCVMIFPWARAWYFERQMRQVAAQWLDARDEAAGRVSPSAADDTKANTSEAAPPESVNSARLHGGSFPIENMEGFLSIPAIDLRTPILSESNEYNLNLSVCRLTGTAAGEYGNYCLAGHKSRTVGRHFNRLHEVIAGNDIIVETARDVYTYQVTDVFTVTAEDRWVLDDDFDKKQITLITCDYGTQPVGRLIVCGVMVEEVP